MLTALGFGLIRIHDFNENRQRNPSLANMYIVEAMLSLHNGLDLQPYGNTKVVEANAFARQRFFSDLVSQ